MKTHKNFHPTDRTPRRPADREFTFAARGSRYHSLIHREITHGSTSTPPTYHWYSTHTLVTLDAPESGW